MVLRAPCPIFGERQTLQMVLLRVKKESADLLTASRWETSGLRHCPCCARTKQSFHAHAAFLLAWVVPPRGQSHALHQAPALAQGIASGRLGQCASANLVPCQCCPKPSRLRREEIPSLPLPFFKTLVDNMVDFLWFVSLYKIKHCYYRGRILTRNKCDDWHNSTFCSFHLGCLAKILCLTQQIWQV